MSWGLTSATSALFDAAMNPVWPRRLIAVIALVIACPAVASDGGALLGLQSMCPSVYQPVCASKDGANQTVANACLATRDGFTIVSQGKCGGGNAGLPRFCSKEYLPVCAESAAEQRTFGNICEARAEDFVILHEGSC